MSASILLIEDCPEEQQSLYETLCEEGYQVSIISDPDEAMATVEHWARQYHLVIIEEVMHGRCGLKLLQQARSTRNNLPVVMVTRDGDWEGYSRALSEGASGYIAHPVDRTELMEAVSGALAQN